MSDDLIAFPINIKQTLKHLRQDMKDDWFYDAVRYEDLLTNAEDLLTNADDLSEILTKNLNINHGKYETGHKATYDVPKKALGLRYTLEFLLPRFTDEP
ncbi:hypothetical protein MAH1_14080 [Sessilibacter sp. MAH1]